MRDSPLEAGADSETGTQARLSAATGIIYFVLVLASVMTFDEETPSLTAPAEQVAGFYAQNASRIGLSAALFLVAIGFFLWFLGTLRSVLLQAEGRYGRLSSIAFGAGLVTAAMSLASVGMATQIVFVEDLPGLDPATVRGLQAGVVLADGFMGVGTIARAVLAAAVAVAAIKWRALPAWLGWVSALVAAGSALGSLALIEHAGDGPFGGIWFFSFMGFFFWVLLVSIVLTVRRGPATAPTSAA